MRNEHQENIVIWLIALMMIGGIAITLYFL